MNAFEWRLDLRFVLPNQTNLRVLQRAVQDTKVFKQDLTPFYKEPAVWILRATLQNAAVQKPTIGEGFLKRFSSVDGTDFFLVSFRDGREINVPVPNVQKRGLTVWRYREQLDMLQIPLPNVGSLTAIRCEAGT